MNMPNLINNIQNDNSKIKIYFRLSGSEHNINKPIEEQCSFEEIFEDVLKRIHLNINFFTKNINVYLM